MHCWGPNATSDAETSDAETGDRETTENKLPPLRDLDTVYLL